MKKNKNKKKAKQRPARHFKAPPYKEPPDLLDDVLIADSGAEQSLLGVVWRVLKPTSRYVNLLGPLQERHGGVIFQVVSAAAKLIDEDGKEYCAVIHEGLLDRDENQKESLLASAQVRHAGNAIDDCHREALNPNGDPGTQCSKVGDTTLPFLFDGAKCFYNLKPITKEELKTLPRVEFTQDAPYEPTKRITTRRLTSEELEWKRRLGFPPDKVVKDTLKATTQFIPRVEAESREIMRDHIKSRLPALRLSRRNDTDYLDTFKSSIVSVRGYKYFNLFASEKSLYDDVHLMVRKSDSDATIKDHFLRVGAPTKLKSDNAKEFTSAKTTKILRETYVERKLTEPHHPQQNLAEARGGRLKHAVQQLLTATQAPLTFWCYAVEYMAFLRQRTARRKLKGRTSVEAITGGIPDISKCRFTFWQPIWYYTPRRAFPRQRMLPARFLGFSDNSGDAFTYVIAVEPEDDSESYQVYTRSVIRPRYMGSSRPADAPIVLDHGNKLEIYRRDGRPVLCEEDEDDVIDLTADNLPSNPLPHDRTAEPSHLDDADEFEEAIHAVYGEPAHKRLRIDETTNIPLQTADRPQQSSTSPEENTVVQEPASEPLEFEPPIVEVPAIPATTAKPVPNVPNRQPATVTQPDDDEISVDSASSSEEDNEVVTTDSVDQYLHNLAGNDEDMDLFDSIVGTEFKDGELMFKVKWKTDEVSCHPFHMVREDYPYETAVYIRDNQIGTQFGTHKQGPIQRWSRSFLRKSTRVLRRFLRYNGFQKPMRESQVFVVPEEHDSYATHLTRAITTCPRQTRSRRAKKPGRLRRQVEIKFGVKIPMSVRQALEFDRENGDSKWRDAMAKEIAQLVALNCFDFHPPDFKPDKDSQEGRLTMIFEVKQDGRHKGRLVCNGHKIDPRGISTRSTVVKGISVRLLDVIAHRDGLEIIHGDVGNAFITADCLEKIHARAGKEFGPEKEGCVVTLNKALYGLRTSSRAYRETFAKFLRHLGFVSTRYDRDVWMRLREEGNGYDYLCTHVDDFKVVAKDPQRWVDAIGRSFQLKCAGAPDYYLGMDYKYNEEEKCWQTGTNTYIKECINRIEAMLPQGRRLVEHKTPSPSEDYQPEYDQSEFLSTDGKRQFQMMIGMAQWAVTIGRMDICHAVSSLSRFSAAPRSGHLELAFYLFGYLKKEKSRDLIVDSRPIKIHPSMYNPKEKAHQFDADFLLEYPDAGEEFDPKAPIPFGSELQTSVMFDANHAHDKKTRRSITGILVYVGSTLVSWSAKRQGCIASSTYTAEFMAMRAGVEEAISIRYMLRSLGVPVTDPTFMFGDNMSVINTARLVDGELKKKHVAISYHLVREAVAGKIIRPIWCNTKENWADICTKSLAFHEFNAIVGRTML